MNNETIGVQFKTLDKICELLDCDPGDIIVRKKSRKKVGRNEQTSKAV